MLNSVIGRWLEIAGGAILLAWTLANPQEFNRITEALSNATVGSVRTLQGRG